MSKEAIKLFEKKQYSECSNFLSCLSQTNMSLETKFKNQRMWAKCLCKEKKVKDAVLLLEDNLKLSKEQNLPKMILLSYKDIGWCCVQETCVENNALMIKKGIECFIHLFSNQKYLKINELADDLWAFARLLIYYEDGVVYALQFFKKAKCLYNSLFVERNDFELCRDIAVSYYWLSKRSFNNAMESEEYLKDSIFWALKGIDLCKIPDERNKMNSLLSFIKTDNWDYIIECWAFVRFIPTVHYSLENITLEKLQNIENLIFK